MILFKTILLLFWIYPALELSSFSDTQVKLVVEVDNIKHTTGQPLRLAVERKEGFLSENKPFDYAIVEAVDGKISYSFSLPKGDYAISVYHDLNGNEKLDKNFFGAPVEPYGFSRNFKPLLRAPRFDEVKISLNQDRKINILLLHP